MPTFGYTAKAGKRILDTSVVMNCPVCGNDSRKSIILVRDYLSGIRKHQYFECDRCKSLSRLAKDEENYESSTQNIARSKSFMLRKMLSRMDFIFLWVAIRSLRRQLGDESKVLDIGCGTGKLMRVLASFGYTPYGIEPNATKCADAKKKFKDTVVCDILKPGHFGNLSFDLLILWHVLEHLENFDNLFACLKGYGAVRHKIVIALPVVSSLQWKLYGTKWFHAFSPLHATLFSEIGIRALFKHHGYTLDSVSHLDFISNFEGHVISLCNAMGIKQNFAFNFIQRQSQASLPRVFLFALNCLLIFLVFPVAFILTAFELCLSNSGCPIYIFRKG